jgi:hypothetical protein
VESNPTFQDEKVEFFSKSDPETNNFHIFFSPIFYLPHTFPPHCGKSCGKERENIYQKNGVRKTKVYFM